MIWKGRCDDMESKHEYLENMSRRNNIKILGLLEDKLKEKSWDDTEELVKGVIKECREAQGCQGWTSMYTLVVPSLSTKFIKKSH